MRYKDDRAALHGATGDRFHINTPFLFSFFKRVTLASEYPGCRRVYSNLASGSSEDSINGAIRDVLRNAYRISRDAASTGANNYRLYY